MNMRFANQFEARLQRVQTMPRKRLVRLAIAGAAAIVALIALVAYLVDGSGARKRPVPSVVVGTAVSKTVPVVEHVMGTVVANATVQVTAQVTGQLLKADFQEGQIVKKGEKLFEIDPRPFEAALQQARAQLAKDSAQLANARNDERRYNALFAQNAVSPQQRDQAVTNAKSAAAAVAADRAAVEVAKINLGYTEIRSPIDGKTGPILIQPGNLVSADGTKPLVVVTQIEPVKVSFALPQADLPRIQAREREGTLTATLDAHGKGRISAPVDFVSNEVSDQTGTIELRATFGNRNHRLVPGQMVDVAVSLATLKHATVVPREAVNDGPDGRYVFVVTGDGKAVMRPVKVLFDDGATMAIQGDVKPGDKVIRDGQFGVSPGEKVKVTNNGAARGGPAQRR